MNTNRRTANSLHYRFRRWTRKAYAVFASLQRVISIGTLVVATTGATLMRGLSGWLTIPAFSKDPADDATSDDPTLVAAELQQLQLQSLNLFVVNSETGVACGNSCILYLIHYNGYRGFGPGNRFFMLISIVFNLKILNL